MGIINGLWSSAARPLLLLLLGSEDPDSDLLSAASPPALLMRALASAAVLLLAGRVLGLAGGPAGKAAGREVAAAAGRASPRLSSQLRHHAGALAAASFPSPPGGGEEGRKGEGLGWRGPSSAPSSSPAGGGFRPLGSASLPLPPAPLEGPHYVFLVHGWLGNEQEMAYLETALQVEAMVSGGRPRGRGKGGAGGAGRGIAPDVVVHKATCNNGRTTDGIAAGGTRLAEEVAGYIAADVRRRRRGRGGPGSRSGSGQHDVTVSFVGNSLGGLYSRYALSLLPSELRVPAAPSSRRDGGADEGADAEAGAFAINLHPNVFCTTATPHLGVASNTYLPIPRFAELAIGKRMDVTGMDLFRMGPAAIAEAIGGGGREAGSEGSRETGGQSGRGSQRAVLPRGGEGQGQGGSEGRESPLRSPARDEAPATSATPDLIYRMATEPAFLGPLASFQRRIAYANAFGTDFQVPTNTAAFLSELSTYPHRFCNASEREGLDFIASVLYTDRAEELDGGSEGGGGRGGGWAALDPPPPSPPGSPAPARDADAGMPSGEQQREILAMSQNLDRLGWTKVFVDSRDGIPLPSLVKPSFLPGFLGGGPQNSGTGLDVRTELKMFVEGRRTTSFLQQMGEEGAASPGGSAAPVSERRQDSFDAGDGDGDGDGDGRGEEKGRDPSENERERERALSTPVVIESKELSGLMKPNERMHFPLGHTVMVANSKSGLYAKINAKGQPIMDKLATELVGAITDF